MTTRISLFEKASHASKYVKYRPSYPPAVFQRILSFLAEKKTGPYDLQVDVGCGSGQATHGLASHFKRVIGFDISQAQIEEASIANKNANVEFRVSAGESLPLEDGTVDLLTCAQAAHWLDFPAFCKETDRVLKPSGCHIVFGYGTPWLDHKNLDTKGKLKTDFDELYQNRLGSSWNERRRLIENKFMDLSLPYEDSTRDDSYEMRMQWSVAHLIGYLKSWSSYQTYLANNPSETDVLSVFEKKVMSNIASSEDVAESTMIDVVMPVFMLLGRKPAGP